MIPDLVFDVQACEPAAHRVVVDRIDQLALAADGKQDLQQQGLEQQLRWQRGAGIHRLDPTTHGRQRRIDHGAQLAQRVCRWHSHFKADVAEDRPLEVCVASHLPGPGCSFMASDRSGRLARRRSIFQRLLSVIDPEIVSARESWRVSTCGSIGGRSEPLVIKSVLPM